MLLACGGRIGAAMAVASLSIGVLAQDTKAPPPGSQSKAAAADEQPRPTKPVAAIGKPAPEFALADTTGKKHKLSDYKGRVVVLEWVSKDCPWSVAACPLSNSTAAKFAGQKVVWLAIDSDKGHDAAGYQDYIKEKKLSYPILLDSDGAVGHSFGARVTPHLFIIDKSGKLAYDGALMDKDRNFVAEALDALVTDKAVAVSTTKPVGCPVKYRP